VAKALRSKWREAQEIERRIEGATTAPFSGVCAVLLPESLKKFVCVSYWRPTIRPRGPFNTTYAAPFKKRLDDVRA
jgi:hypothetical protein